MPHLSSVLILTMLLLLMGCGAASASDGGGTPSPDSTPSPPERVLENPYEGMTREQMEQIHEQWVAEGLVTPRAVGGLETAGSAIDIAGQSVQLPEDAYVSGLWWGIGVGGPYWEVIRGESSLAIHRTTGEVLGVALAPGEEDAFDFVEEALAGPSWTIGAGVSGLLAGIGVLALAYSRRWPYAASDQMVR